ncbi:hypothetical protein [Streptomyces sp. NPDC001410]|uniref:effector-associated constant component EACC1 n=1 Tax=Streptomyces sp. NPDC001410 TaxID=3364574 RepID=UPI0036A1A3EC
MRVTLAVETATGDHASATDDLYDWLRQDPELRGLVRREAPGGVPTGAMGAWSELLTLLLAPGGPTAAVGAAVVVWLQNRRGNVTVTVSQPDGTQVVVFSEKVRGLTAEATSELAQRVARALDHEPAGEGTGAVTEREGESGGSREAR